LYINLIKNLEFGNLFCTIYNNRLLFFIGFFVFLFINVQVNKKHKNKLVIIIARISYIIIAFCQLIFMSIVIHDACIVV